MKRKIDKSLLASYVGRSCIVCGTTFGTCAHHIKSVGSGGDDDFHNLACLCHEHHVEIHTIGRNSFAQKHRSFEIHLKAHGWKFDDFIQKWVRLTKEGWDDSQSDNDG